MEGQTATGEVPLLGSNFNRGTDQHLQGKAIANAQSSRRDQVPAYLSPCAKRPTLPKGKKDQPPEIGTVSISSE